MTEVDTYSAIVQENPLLKQIDNEISDKKFTGQPRSLEEIKQAINDLKNDYSSNLETLIKLQNKFALLRKLDAYQSTDQIEEYQQCKATYDSFINQFSLIKKELYQLTEGPFHVREEALDMIVYLDNLKNGKYAKIMTME